MRCSTASRSTCRSRRWQTWRQISGVEGWGRNSVKPASKNTVRIDCGWSKGIVTKSLIHGARVNNFAPILHPMGCRMGAKLFTLALINPVGGGKRGTGVGLETTTRKNMLQSGKNSIYILTARIVAHQANANESSLKRAKTTTDLDIVLLQQCLAYRQFVHTLWQANCCQYRQLVAGLRQDTQAQCLDTCLESITIQLVPCPTRLQAFLLRDTQRLAHPINEIATGGVMVGMVAVPVAVEIMQVKIVALHRMFAVPDNLYSTFIECDGSETGQCTQAFLATSITGINLHRIHVHRYAAQTTDCIYHKQGIMRMRHALKLFQRLQQSG